MTYNEAVQTLKEMLDATMYCSCDNENHCKRCNSFQGSIKEALALEYAIIYMEQHLNE